MGLTISSDFMKLKNTKVGLVIVINAELIYKIIVKSMILVNKMTWCHRVDETLSIKLLNCNSEL